MAKERSVMKLIWNSFISSLKPRFARRRLVGEDYYGTKYYEEDIINSSRTKAPRYFVPVNKDDFEQEIPAEWESWLRYRRRDPPTQEEIETNYRIAMSKKENAAKLLEKNNSKNETTKEPSLFTQPSTSQPTNPGNFPVYEEYKGFASNYTPKDSYKY